MLCYATYMKMSKCLFIFHYSSRTPYEEKNNVFTLIKNIYITIISGLPFLPIVFLNYYI